MAAVLEAAVLEAAVALFHVSASLALSDAQNMLQPVFDVLHSAAGFQPPVQEYIRQHFWSAAVLEAVKPDQSVSLFSDCAFLSAAMVQLFSAPFHDSVVPVPFDAQNMLRPAFDVLHSGAGVQLRPPDQPVAVVLG